MGKKRKGFKWKKKHYSDSDQHSDLDIFSISCCIPLCLILPKKAWTTIFFKKRGKSFRNPIYTIPFKIWDQ